MEGGRPLVEGRLLAERRPLLEAGSPIVEVRSNGEREGILPLLEGGPLLMVEEGLPLVNDSVPA